MADAKICDICGKIIADGGKTIKFSAGESEIAYNDVCTVCHTRALALAENGFRQKRASTTPAENPKKQPVAKKDDKPQGHADVIQ